MVAKTSIAASQINPHMTANKAVTTQHLQNLMQAKRSVLYALQLVCYSSIISHWTAVHLAAASKVAHCSIVAVLPAAAAPVDTGGAFLLI